jgi:hypothetical protein
MNKQTDTELVNPHAPSYQGLIELTAAYSDALLMEAEAQKAFLDAQSLTQYRRDEVVLGAYTANVISGGNERQRKLQEGYVIADDLATAYLEGYEDQALKALTLATVERKRIEAEIGLTKAWLYSISGQAVR